MKRLLILCDQFPPAFGPRMGYLCKYLKQNGWQPTVISEYIPDETFAFLKGDTDVTFINDGQSKTRIEWLKSILLEIFFGYKNKKMEREAEKKLRQQKFDALLCSTYRTFPLPAAQKIAQKYHLPWVADLRDIIEQYTGNEFISHSLPKLGGLENIIATIFKHRSLKQRNRAIQKANYITTISPWHVSVLEKFNSHIELIYNGYDPELFYPTHIETEQFYISYTGRLISISMRNPDLLFKAIHRLSSEGIITPDTFRLRWFVDKASQQMLENKIEQHPIADYMDYFGYVPATQIPTVLNESSMLLLLTNKADANGPKGVMTTKLFEAMAVEKPILCVRGDEGCIEEVINRTQSGLSAHNEEDVYQFIKKYYDQWKAEKCTSIKVNHDEIQKFSRKTQASQFAEIFNRIITNHV